MKVASVVIVFNRKGEILFLDRNSYPFGLGLPGGKAEENETPLQTAVRELKEETGIEASGEDLVLHKTSSSVTHSMLLYSYVLRIPLSIDDEEEIKISDEHGGFTFLDVPTIRDYNEIENKLAAGTFELL